jgi:type IV pilus assembly protein PilY1
MPTKIKMLRANCSVWNRPIGFGRFVSLCSLLLPLQLTAAPGTISDNPLFLQSGIQPNIFFILDDSGSMDWEVLLSQGAQAAYPDNRNDSNLDYTPDQESEWLEFCAGYNVLAYNPKVKYTPWRGRDSAGNAFQNQNPSNAQVNPYTGGGGTGACGDDSINNSNGQTCDLLNTWDHTGDTVADGAFYFVWNDEDKKGQFDEDECSTDLDDRYRVRDLPLVSTSDNPNSQTNFANWFSYYRKREYVMKRAVSQVVEASQERMGLATINRGNRVLESTLLSSNTWEVGTPVKDIDDFTGPINMTARGDKKILLDNLLAVNSGGGTPLRMALNNTGRYFQGAMSDESLFAYTPSAALNSANGSSPILNLENGGQCQQNFALLFSDGYWNGQAPAGIGNSDQGSGAYDGRSYADTYESTLADVAMHYYKTDLMPDLVDEVSAVSLKVGDDDNKHQHLTTFTIAFGVSGAISCNPTDRELSVSAQNYPGECEGYTGTNAWPDPTASIAHKIDDMRHAAWNGRGQFMNATNSADLIKQLQAVIEDIARRTTSSAAAVTVNAGQFQQGDLLYKTGFSSSTWSGTLSAVRLTTNGVGDVEWLAHKLLTDRDLGSDARSIITYNGEKGIDFEFSGANDLDDDDGLSQRQVDDLLKNAPNQGFDLSEEEISENEKYGELLVAFLKGDIGNEGKLFRERDGLLGDIIYSSPRYVGAPDLTTYPNYIESKDHAYKGWASGPVKDRTEMLYVGSNDGMLHAFEAETGRESFAYIPHALFSSESEEGLHWLADELYDHRAYVDQTPTVMDAFIYTPDDSNKEWRTVLVGGLRSGGKSLYALDVTDPDEFESEDVMWEFSHDQLGYTFSRPAIVKLNNGEWAAIFGNGYNSDPTGDGSAQLFIVNLATGELVRDPLKTGVGTVVNNNCSDINSDCNGLATPATIDTDGDGVVDRVYIGDLKGNMWVFDISGSDPNSWGSAYGSTNPMPLFTAVDGTGASQPITAQPRLTLHTTKKGRVSRPNIMVYFGTGQYLTSADIGNSQQQSFYAIWDSGSTTTRSQLLEQTITYHSEKDVRTMSDEPIAYGTSADEHRGWFTDFDTSGERVVVTPLIFGKLVVYNTIIPIEEICGSAVSSWLMVHDLFDGGRPDFIALDVNNDGHFLPDDDQQNGINVSGVRSGNLGLGTGTILDGTDGTGRLIGQRDDGDLDEQLLRGRSKGSIDASWARFDF